MRWKPLTLDFLLNKHGLKNVGVVFLLFGWIVIIASCLYVILGIDIQQAGFSENISTVINNDYLLMQLPVWMGILLVFWLGFEWGFIPVFLSAVIMALGSTMAPQWAILYGLSFVLGLAIYALAYFCVPSDISLRSLKSIAFFTVVSVIASLASSLGSFIWSASFNLSIAEAMFIWKRWWTGIFFGSAFIIGPLLYFFTPLMVRLKHHYFVDPPNPKVSISWIYSTIASVAAVLILFILSAKTLASSSLMDQLPALSEPVIQNVQGANEMFAMVTWISIGLILTTSVMAIYLMSNWNRKLKEKVDEQTVELSQKEKMLRETIDNRDKLLHEIHDRIRSNLSIVLALLELQLKNNAENPPENLLRDSHSRIRSMALIHETMAGTQSASRVNIKKYAYKLSNRLRQSYKKMRPHIDISIEAEDLILDINKAFPVAIILNELLENAYEHGFRTEDRGNIYIEIQNSSNAAMLRVKNTGMGLPDDFGSNSRSTLGIKLIRTLTRQLHAEFKIEDYDTPTFSLQIPHYEEPFRMN